MDILPVAVGDEPALRAWHAVVVAASAVDSPGAPAPAWPETATALTVPWPGMPARAWVARDGAGAVVGVAVLALPSRDNPGTGVVEVVVHPAHRRRGTGTALLATAAAAARADGRVRLQSDTLDPLDGEGPGTAFARAAGAEQALVDVRRRLSVGEPGTAPAPAVAGYELVTWTGGTPADRQDEVARLTGRMSLDSPAGALEWEPEVHDAVRVRERDAMCRARGFEMTVTAAAAPDGVLAAFTELVVRQERGTWAYQWNTLVDPPHRGHGLGMAVKAANLAAVRARHPGLRTVQTVNAADNLHMGSINEALGFRVVDRLVEWQLPLGPGRPGGPPIHRS